MVTPLERARTVSKAIYNADGSKSEAGVKKDVKEWLIAHRIYDTRAMASLPHPRGFFWMPVPGGMGISGVSDFLICFQGKLIVPEAKAENKPAKPSPDQRIFLENIRLTGGIGFVFNSLKMFVDIWIKEVDIRHYLIFPNEL